MVTIKTERVNFFELIALLSLVNEIAINFIKFMTARYGLLNRFSLRY